MKKFSFILASLMLCFAVSMSSCSDKKGSANDSSASASDSTTTSASGSASGSVAGAINNEADLVAYLNSATEQIASASSVDDLKVVFEDIDVKMGDFAKANPNFQPSEETLVALSNAQNALQNKLNELGIDINALVNGGSEEVVATATEYAQDGAEQVGEAIEAVEMPADIDF
ncbi:MAG: hypothetical protein K2L93_02125 [Muribaculaceae bacterium]|nr:hypothetical protein [Muribaculaceae bacterium]